jgi:uncharacterized protein YozE (UPF0346 family)
LTHDELAEQLAEFDRDPKQAMNKLPVKKEHGGEQRQQVSSLFTAASRQGNAFVEQRDRYRKLLSMERDGQLVRLGQVQPGRAPFQQNDRAEDLVDGPAGELVRTLEEMEKQELLSAELAQGPWSDWYWPIYQGILGARYNDPAFPLKSQDWKEKYDYILKNPASTFVSRGGDAVNRLSPSEKYDLLIGDADGYLTQAMWDEGERYYDQSGKVELWMGICHGWSPAAYMLPRPAAAIEVLAADGKTLIKFYPSDLKALGSLVWAKGAPSVRFIGGRCNDKTPAMDENGRVISQQCFDTNPGTFHLALVNQIGVRERSFILDATFDYEVWNQPIYSYSYTYFNPQTRKPAKTLAAAKVARSAFPGDRFAKYRSDKATHLVGIGLELAYVAETMPSSDESDTLANDYQRVVNYTYDLELDAEGRILGGEWYANAHPDFLWTPPPGVMASATTDYAATGDWADGAPPLAWRRAAIAAARNGQPLGKLVAALFGRSHGKQG